MSRFRARVVVGEDNEASNRCWNKFVEQWRIKGLRGWATARGPDHSGAPNP